MYARMAAILWNSVPVMTFQLDNFCLKKTPKKPFMCCCPISVNIHSHICPTVLIILTQSPTAGLNRTENDKFCSVHFSLNFFVCHRLAELVMVSCHFRKITQWKGSMQYVIICLGTLTGILNPWIFITSSRVQSVINILEVYAGGVCPCVFFLLFRV